MPSAGASDASARERLPPYLAACERPTAYGRPNASGRRNTIRTRAAATKRSPHAGGRCPILRTRIVQTRSGLLRK